MKACFTQAFLNTSPPTFSRSSETADRKADTMYRPSACLLLFLAAPVLAAPRSDFSDDRTAQRLWQDTRQTMQEQEQKVREYRLDIPAEHIGQAIETDPEADQGEALFNAVNRSDWQTVRPLFERYTQQTEYDPDIALFARASLARGEGRWKAAKQDYETLLQRHPDFTRGRLDYARLLFEGRLNREATSEFMRLQNEDLPEAVKENIGHFRDSLNQRQSWQGSLSVGAVHNSNINEASGKTWCKTEIDGECWEEFSGDQPISANGIKYEAAAVRRWQIKGHHGIAAARSATAASTATIKTSTNTRSTSAPVISLKTTATHSPSPRLSNGTAAAAKPSTAPTACAASGTSIKAAGRGTPKPSGNTSPIPTKPACSTAASSPFTTPCPISRATTSCSTAA